MSWCRVGVIDLPVRPNGDAYQTQRTAASAWATNVMAVLGFQNECDAGLRLEHDTQMWLTFWSQYCTPKNLAL